MNIPEITVEGVTYSNVPVDGLSLLGLSKEKIDEIVLEQTKADKIVELSQLHSDALRKMTGDPTLEENLTWTPKELAAKAIISGIASDSERSLIACEAEITGDDPLRLAKYVVGKKEFNYPIIGKLSGLRRKAKSGVEKAKTLDEVDRACTEFCDSVASLKSSI